MNELEHASQAGLALPTVWRELVMTGHIDHDWSLHDAWIKSRRRGGGGGGGREGRAAPTRHILARWQLTLLHSTLAALPLQTPVLTTTSDSIERHCPCSTPCSDINNLDESATIMMRQRN